MRTFLIAIATACLFALSAVDNLVAKDNQQASNVTSFQLYYGGNENHVTSLLNDIQTDQLVVVDLRSLTEAQLDQLKKKTNEANATLIAYVSIGELHSRETELFETFAKSRDAEVNIEKLKSDVLIGDNTVFSSYHVDVANPIWRSFIFDKTAKVLAKGVDGFFLDTVDTVDIYAMKEDWSAEHRSRSVKAMVSLIREIKKQNSGAFTLQNRGLNIIGKQVFIADANGTETPGLSLAQPHQYNPDVILFEDAFDNPTNEWVKQIIVKLDAVQRSGETTVVALGYADIIKDKEKFKKQCKEYNFVPAWASNSENLHLERAR